MTLGFSKPIKKKVRKPERVEGGSRFEVHSGGFAAMDFSKIMVNNEDVATCKDPKGCRGLNVVMVDAFTHKILHAENYDTHGDVNNSGRLLEVARSMEEGTIFLVSVKGDAAQNLGGKVKRFFRVMGSEHVDALGVGDSWAFVGVKGQKAFVEERGTGEEPVGTGAILGYAKKVKHYKKTTKISGGSKIEVHSAGYVSGNEARVLINEKEVFTNKEANRGINLVALDFETHKVVYKNSYDTFGGAAASAQLVKDYKEKLPEFCIVVAAVKDEASRKLSKEVKELFGSLGSNAIKNLKFREGWAFIGVKGLKKSKEKKGEKVGTAMIIGYGKISRKEVRKQIKTKPEKVKGGSRIEVQSAGFVTGNFATINVAN